MPLRYFKNTKTGEIKRSLKVLEGEWEEVIQAPNSKFMVCADPGTNRSKIKDLEPILKERARNYSRDVDLDDNIQINKDNELGVSQNFLNEKGEKRKKIDDL